MNILKNYRRNKLAKLRVEINTLESRYEKFNSLSDKQLDRLITCELKIKDLESKLGINVVKLKAIK